jgi:branched-chain amino acid transport system ATP-binding protein
VKVLHGVSLELHAGEVVCIIGPNGAGKTTLLRTISGLRRPTGGAIAFKGEALAGAKPHQMARRGLAIARKDAGCSNIFRSRRI